LLPLRGPPTKVPLSPVLSKRHARERDQLRLTSRGSPASARRRSPEGRVGGRLQALVGVQPLVRRRAVARIRPSQGDFRLAASSVRTSSAQALVCSRDRTLELLVVPRHLGGTPPQRLGAFDVARMLRQLGATYNQPRNEPVGGGRCELVEWCDSLFGALP